MKTIEETLRERAHDLKYNVGVIHSNPKLILEESFISGYNEALRWRDPEKELPEEVRKLFLCKIGDKRNFKYNGEYSFNVRYCKRDEDVSIYFNLGEYEILLGWRPIE